MTPIRLHPGEHVDYVNVKYPKASMGPASFVGIGPKPPRNYAPVRVRAVVIDQAHGPANHNVLLAARRPDGSVAYWVTTWGHCRRPKA